MIHSLLHYTAFELFHIGLPITIHGYVHERLTEKCHDTWLVYPTRDTHSSGPRTGIP